MTDAGMRGPRPLTLAVDAATYAGTVAVLAGRELLAEGGAAMRGEREERLMPVVAEALRAAGGGAGDVGLVVCGGGPGSFTSLRIAAAIAKGLASARAIPLRAVSSLWLLAAGARPRLAPGEYLAALDAMRGEWFSAPISVRPGGAVVQEAGWTFASLAALEERAGRGERVIGPHPAFGGVAPHARGVAYWEQAAEAPGVAVSLDGWEPDYGRKAEAQVRWEAEHGRPLVA
jgi:tRNA threonylcarbamoyladenosine biosynthesis protein TsaB